MSKRPKLEIDVPDDVAEFFITGAFGGLSPAGGNILFYVEDPEIAMDEFDQQIKVRKVVRKGKVILRMSPSTFKSIALWMNANLAAYESKFGEIFVPEHLKSQNKNTPMEDFH
ncbi:MAG: hypothetical protein D6732_19365 [Methanobacteriota archaeon]|nr:MAG: hypothetical protein D6732_19365 [Euryarchaeota archaeon]